MSTLLAIVKSSLQINMGLYKKGKTYWFTTMHQGRRLQDLRHTFATRLVRNGVDLYKVKELLGHKTLAMTMRYAHHYPESLRAGIETLDSCYTFATVAQRKIDNG
jgi:integrase